MVSGMGVRSAEASYGDRERAHEGLRPDPAYYCYSLPRGPRGSARTMDTSDGGGEPLFSMPEFGGSNENEDRVMQVNGWSADGLIGLTGLGLGANRHRGLGDTVVQNDIGEATSASRRLSQPASHAFEGRHIGLHHELSSLGALHSGTNISGQSISSPVSQTFAYSVGASLSRNTAPDPQVVTSPSHCISALSMSSVNGRRNVNAPNLYHEVPAESGDLIASLSGLSLSPVGERNHPISPPLFQDEYQNLYHLKRNNNPIKECYYYSNENLNGPCTPPLHSGPISPSQYLNTASPTSALPNYYISGRYPSPLVLGNQAGGDNVPPLQQEAIGISRTDSRALVGGGMTLGPNILASGAELGNFATDGSYRPRMALMDSSYLRSNEYSGATLNDLRKYGGSLANSQVDFLAIQRAAYSDALLRNSQYDVDFVRPSIQTNGFHGNSVFGFDSPCPGYPMGSQTFPSSTIGNGGPFRHMEQIMRSPSSIRSIAGNFVEPWPSEHGYNFEETLAASLLEEFKGNKTRFFELAEIAGHVAEFSADQYGSRFIQQKLETASTLEKNMVFLEIMPHALSLVTDVFGNYVIQKFFEHGNPSQIRQLAEQLIGHVLTLSLQMYGCRVIQKAIEVIELDQQTKMVAELDGHIMRCVRDQNGNHVIQKCIEYVPEAAIQFIVSTIYDQVVTLSSHPYGCRVIQRVLEHCHSPKTQSLVMNEILKSVKVLAQDQYGNYVIQHVLEHGKPHERSIIICQLTGQIVEMSQHKFASNVIEKCLSFGTRKERQTLVHEMLGSTDKNEPLQLMMKDQFANYVVQKVLETCDDDQLELLLNRIKVHLNALKKYTYGKHIVARVEKLVAAGERRISVLSTNHA